MCAVANAQTQADLNDDACGAYREADKKLNAIYQQLLEQHKDDANFTTRLCKAQRAWREEYGSIYPMCSCLEQTALVDHRIEQLSSWLTAEEGDVCRSSR
ncbi:lysozyme inhibitor LprI family protein [Nitrosomonas sp.]|uniref:lysozyme inhibitor LprI family protein n=1 Tax=Nitrosomonas sp. TaxID=42353 RepID=UPI0033903279